MTAKLTFLIIGCSSGFGREIARTALSRGHAVIATSRRSAQLSELQAAGATTIDLDVRDSDTAVGSAVAKAADAHGRIDVLVNNAGYILVGGVDECSNEEIQAQFDTNVFGMLRVLRAVLPVMRKQGKGVIANMGSIGGWRGTPIGGLYCSSKFALVAITESLRVENAGFGIEATIIEPGYFRTNFLSAGHQVTAAKEVPELKELSGSMKARFGQVDGHQPGDPVKGAAVIVDAVSKTGAWKGAELPLRLVLGKDAQDFVGSAMTKWQGDLDQWREVVNKTDHDDVAGK